MCAYSTSMSPLTSTSVHHIMPETHAQKQMPSPVHSQPRSSEEESPSECTEDELSDEDDDMTSVKHESSDQAPKALFLNFSSNLTEQSFGKKKPRSKRQTAYRVNGVNILNRNNLDSKTAIERIKRRRENHNYVERRRRDVINNTIMEIASVVPNATISGQKPNKGEILRLALDYMKQLQNENRQLRQMALDDRMGITPLTPASQPAHVDCRSSPVHSDVESPFRIKHHDFNVFAASAPNSPNLPRHYSPQTASLPSSPIRNMTLSEDNLLPALSLPPATPFVSRPYSPTTAAQTVKAPISPHTNFPVQQQQPPIIHYAHNFSNAQQPQQPPTPLPAPSGLRPILPMRPGPPPQRPINYAQNRMTGLERQYGSVCRY